MKSYRSKACILHFSLSVGYLLCSILWKAAVDRGLHFGTALWTRLTLDLTIVAFGSHDQPGGGRQIQYSIMLYPAQCWTHNCTQGCAPSGKHH